MIKNKNILITGGNSGIGFFTIINLLKTKNNLYVVIKNELRKEEFLEKIKPTQTIFFSAKNKSQVYYEAPYQENCALIFGKESQGLGDEFLEKHSEQTYHLPMDRTHIRSLNLASVVTTASYEAFRHFQK